MPTVAQRQATFNSFRHKDDLLQISDVEGLSDSLNTKANASAINGKVVLAAGTTFYDVPAGTLLNAIWFIGGASAREIGVGLTNSDTSLFEYGTLQLGGNLLFNGAIPFPAQTRIYFNGTASDVVPIIFKQ